MMVDSDAEFMVSITVNINVYGKQKYRSLCEFAGRWLFDTSQQPSFCMLNNAVHVSNACLFVFFSAVNQEMMALIPLSDKRLRPRRT